MSLLCLLLCFVQVEVDAARALELLDLSTSRIVSYDLRIEVTTEYYYGWQEPATAKHAAKLSAPAKEWRRLARPKTERHLFRQVYSRGLRRIEQLDPESAEPVQIIVYDGKLVKEFSVNERQAAISAGSLEYVPRGLDYRDYLRSWGCIDLVEQQLRVDPTGRVRARRLEDSQVMLECPPLSRAQVRELQSTQLPAIPYMGFRFYLDPNYGYMPRRIVCFDRRERQTAEETQPDTIIDEVYVQKWAGLSGNLWVPVQAVFKAFCTSGDDVGSVSLRCNLTVDMDRSRWNVEIPASTFDVAFPKGTVVWDYIRDVRYVAGMVGTDQYMEKFAKEARKFVVQPPRYEPRPSRTASTRRLFVLGAVFVAGVSLCALVVWLVLVRSARRRS